jgi:hypothetical protein
MNNNVSMQQENRIIVRMYLFYRNIRIITVRKSRNSEKRGCSVRHTDEIQVQTFTLKDYRNFRNLSEDRRIIVKWIFTSQSPLTDSCQHDNVIPRFLKGRTRGGLVKRQHCAYALKRCPVLLSAETHDILTEICRGFFQSLQDSIGIVSPLRHNHFLCNSSVIRRQIISVTESVVK